MKACSDCRDVRVLVPSEAVLQGGQHATFRLVVRVTTEDGRPLPVRPAVSEKFQVSSRRNRPAKQCGVSALHAVHASAHQHSCICHQHEAQAGCRLLSAGGLWASAWGQKKRRCGCFAHKTSNPLCSLCSVGSPAGSAVTVDAPFTQLGPTAYSVSE